MAAKKTDQDQIQRVARLRSMIESGALHAMRVPNMGARGHWYIFWVYEDSGIKIEDVTLRVARALNYKFSEKHYWLLAHNFNLDGSDMRNDIRDLLDMPDFEWKVIT